ncbi:Protein ERGIC-53-like [Entophlyctis luteolus]|nr:Protein ERGIC-53-like [Entophlyctis luteolus]
MVLRLAALLFILLRLVVAATARAPPAANENYSNSATSGADAVENVSHADMERKYDYKQSFKKPFFVLPHSHDNKIPFYEYSGDATPSNDYIRLTSSLPDQSGSIWAETQNNKAEWQVHFAFKVGGGAYAGGNGLALWYTKERNVKGPLMGSKDAWTGLGLVFSTSAREENRYTPLIYAVVNDGTKEIVGKPLPADAMAGSCFRNYRNSQVPVWVRVTYKNRQLRVDVDLYKDGYLFIECFRAKNVDIPKGYYFGASASTGVHAQNDHDIYALEVFEVHPHPRKSKSKFQDEFKLSNSEQRIVDDMKAAIDEANQDFKDSGLVEDEEEVYFDPQIVRSLQENQFKIIEALNQLEQGIVSAPKVAMEGSHDRASSGVQKVVQPVEQKIEEIKGKVYALETQLNALDNDIKKLLNVFNAGSSIGQTKLAEVSKKLDESHSKIKDAEEAIVKAAEATSVVSSYAMYGLFFIVGGVVVYAVSVIVRMRKDRAPKKYI